MIEVPQLWLPDRLRERREDERLLPPGRTRRWMPGYPCCPKGCLLFEDDFERESIGDEWATVSGDWSIDSGRLTSSDASAKICIEAGSQKINELEGSVVVDCVIPRVNGAKVRIYTSGSDYVELTFTANQVQANINGGTGGQYRSVGTAGSFRVCHSNRYIIVILDGITVLKSEYSNAVPGDVCLGFGSDAGGGASGFNSVAVQHGLSKSTDCPHCAICANCNSLPGALEVTLSGLTLYEGAGYVHDCLVPSIEDFANDTFILEPLYECRYTFGCVIPTECRKSGENPYEDVWFWIGFEFRAVRTYSLRVRTEWQSGAGTCNEPTGQLSFSTDTCVGTHGGWDTFSADDWTCEPDNYEFENIYRGCPDLLDFTNANFKVSAL